MTDPQSLQIQSDYLHVQYEEKGAFSEIYGISGNQGMVNLEAVLIRPTGIGSRTLLIFMLPAIRPGRRTRRLMSPIIGQHNLCECDGLPPG